MYVCVLSPVERVYVYVHVCVCVLARERVCVLVSANTLQTNKQDLEEEADLTRMCSLTGM